MILELNRITKNYLENQPALVNISCRLETGLIGIIGPNAAGKTTLAKILAGIENPTDGQIFLNQLDLNNHKLLLRSMLGYLPQEFGFYQHITAEDMLHHIAVLKGIHTKAERRYQVDKVMDMVNLRESAKTVSSEYSFGMKRRLGIAQALLANPRILIFDEPLEGLDQSEQVRVGQLFDELARQRLVIIATHFLNDFDAAARTLILLHQGRLVFHGTSTELAKLADGAAWEAETDYEQLELLKASYRIMGVHHDGGRMFVRLLGCGRPPGKVSSLKATVEDGYLMMMDRNDQ
ncbi:ATP-binding cassette domain-containing protein [bacterium BFN5]|nr:ATP-binding cassette domain-containing protein [bacterium BFN5]QJW45127.1 ATP-binding cassette domain-containing protein [bacterium BFN5]